MTRMLVAALALSAAFAAPALAADPTYKVVDRIKLPDGGWDYIVSDTEHGRIIRTRTDGADLIDVKTGKVTTLKNNGNGHMIVPVPGTALGVIPLRMPEKMIRIMDTMADKIVADVPGGEGPDGAVYDPFSKHVFVANHNGGTVTEVDPVGGKSLAQIEVGKEGKLEFPASDGAGRVFDDAGYRRLGGRGRRQEEEKCNHSRSRRQSTHGGLQSLRVKSRRMTKCDG